MVSYLSSSCEGEHVDSAPCTTADVPDRLASVSIIVPTLNEAENVDQILGDIVEHVYGRFNFEIIVTDGGSTDGTCEKVARWETTSTHPVSLVRNDGTGGLAEDVLSAALRAKFSILVILDADGSHPAASIASGTGFANQTSERTRHE
jgi:dolichol-phosphate mannosyltransferase